MADYARTGQVGPTLALLSAHALEDILRDWAFWGRAEQKPPPGDWTSWLILGGRGAGKTRSGAEFVRAAALGLSEGAQMPVSPIALVGETYDEARAVMVEGSSGLLAIHKASERPDWKPARRMLEWPNGARAYVHSAESHEALRGPQFAAAWLDEVAKWRLGEAAFDQLQFGLRVGLRPRQVITTTPRPVPLLRALLKREGAGVVVTRMATTANASNLADGFLRDVVGRYSGTRLGRQELDGEMIDDRPDTLFPRGLVDASRVATAPDDLRRIVVAVDPPASSSAGADACGIVAAGADGYGNAYVLADASVQGASPAAWARRAIGLYRRLNADRIVAEVNQGGEMVEAVLRQVDPDVPMAR
ncbi:DNA-packaging protein [Tepidamorphus sp. 3E244]|uniref:DNA-packaging protein n=1 Tax=Tepidamorphus sp. 3E244 TaxID=3385498 RepID=UPI0038FCDE04